MMGDVLIGSSMARPARWHKGQRFAKARRAQEHRGGPTAFERKAIR